MRTLWSRIYFILIFVILASSLAAEDVTPRTALQVLKEGNARYVSGDRWYPMLDAARREDTAKNGQHPFATIMGCSDSRVPIEHIFDVGIGDIFPIRVAGNVSDVDEIGSIEYGIEHLHTPVMVVLGHTGCGAVTAVVRGDHVSGSIPSLVDNIIPAAEQAKEKMGSAFSADLVNEAVKLNVYQSIEDLFRGSEAAVELVESGELEVIGGIYNLETGGVEWLGKHPQEASILMAIESEQKDKIDRTKELDSKEALQILQEGNARYVSGQRIYPMLDASRREDTAKNGQHPFATVMGCSDSRVPLEHVFDVGVGDIFPIRVAGNVSDVDEIGSIEYGIEHLHTPVMVVLGHTGCGAVTAVVRGDHVSGSIPLLVDNIIPAAEQAKEKMGSAFSADLVNEAVKLNVYQSIEDLFRGSEAAVELVESGELEVIGGIYNLETGGVEWLGNHPRESSILRAIESEGFGKGDYKFPIVGIIGSLLSPLLLLLAFFIFISKKAVIKSLKTRGKIIVASLSMVAAVAVPEIIGLSFNGIPGFHITGYYITFIIIIPLISVFLFGIATAGSISSGFKEHLQILKKKYGRA